MISNPNNTKVTIGATTTAILSANANRTMVTIVNDADEAIYIGLGAVAVMSEGTLLPIGGKLELFGDKNFAGAINGICTSGSKNVTVMEAT